MEALLKLCSLIDGMNARIGRIATWLTLIAVVISTANALTRYSLNLSSNAWLEIQWYMFAGMTMLGAAYTLRVNEHVRVDVLYSRYGARTRLWVDFLGGILFLLPMAIVIGWMSWPMLANSFAINETSSNSGGLLRWPVKLMVPLGFLLLTLQGFSEVIKRYAALTGRLDFDAKYEKPLQ